MIKLTDEDGLGHETYGRIGSATQAGCLSDSSDAGGNRICIHGGARSGVRAVLRRLPVSGGRCRTRRRLSLKRSVGRRRGGHRCRRQRWPVRGRDGRRRRASVHGIPAYAPHPSSDRPSAGRSGRSGVPEAPGSGPRRRSVGACLTARPATSSAARRRPTRTRAGSVVGCASGNASVRFLAGQSNGNGDRGKSPRTSLLPPGSVNENHCLGTEDEDQHGSR